MNSRMGWRPIEHGERSLCLPTFGSIGRGAALPDVTTTEVMVLAERAFDTRTSPFGAD